MTTDIDAIRERERVILPGPWRVGEPRCIDDVDDWELPILLDRSSPDGPETIQVCAVEYQTGGFHYPHADAKADAVFIAAARTDVPALLAKVDELTAELTNADDALLDARYTIDQLLADKNAALARANELTAALAQSREQVADYAADNHRAVAQLTAANRRADGLANDLRSAVTANTAWANQSGEQQYLIWSHKQQAWWGPGGHGYRWAITGAGRFPLDKANDHASTRSWPADRKTPPEVVIPAPPLDVLADPERIDGWIDEQIKSATDAKIAARNTEKAEVAR